MITTIKDSLFNAPKGSLLVHACNCRGVWGSGVAKEFAARFPEAYKAYSWHCKGYGEKLAGTFHLLEDNGYYIGCLFTSRGYGAQVDSPSQIIKYTDSALEDMKLKWNRKQGAVNMPRINSGLFKVPWEQTEEVLKKHDQFEYVVWSP